ncbi:MAG: ABC transporter ATP-binding protein [Chloroflexi bacterium]|nr:ABC transporter ATP-binding protein [Chloroflexota bacterium]
MSTAGGTGESPVLQIQDLTMVFGGLRAVSQFSMSLSQGGLYGLIGPNGAGKTTVFNMITGIYTPTSGSILFNGHEISKLRAHQITRLGVARTFQNIRLFQDLSVLDNVRIANHTHAGYSLLEAISRLGRFGRRERALTEQAQDLLAVFGLQDRQHELARNLPYGEQRRLEIARALATHPRMLLLDEPAAGMNPTESETLMGLIRFVRQEFDLTILLIEHQMRVVMGICEWITVMDFGQVIARGTADQIRNNQDVIVAYLGSAARREI